MEFTFGIITSIHSCQFLNEIIDSIKIQNIENYEIIIVGNVTDNFCLERKNIVTIPFDETIYPGWITKKKNLITENAKYENIVFMHDYIKFDPDWYSGFLLFGNDFDIVMNKILDIYNNRFRDLILNSNFTKGQILLSGSDRISPIINKSDNWSCEKYTEPLDMKKMGIPYNENKEILLDYEIDTTKINKFMYISGSFWIAKKKVMKEFPLNETLLHCQGEDVEWSQRVNKKYTFRINTNSVVRLLKHKIMNI
jgi:hypothetical protein